MKQYKFYSVENSIKLSDGSRTRYFDNLDMVKNLIHSELDKLVSENSHVMIHVNYDEGNPPLYFDIFHHNICVFTESDLSNIK